MSLDDSYNLDLASIKTYGQLTESFILGQYSDLKSGVANFLGLSLDDEIIRKLEWTELFSDRLIRLEQATPAQALEDLLLDKWALRQEDKDMIIMQHQFEYELEGKQKKIISSMVTKGEDAVNTSMAKTVGLPVAILVKLILQGKVNLTGVHIPVMAEIYEPVLEELKEYGPAFINGQIK